MSPYQLAKNEKSRLEAAATIASIKLQAYPRNASGITPDSIRNTEGWKADRRKYDAAAAELKKWNAYFLKRFKKEYADDRAKQHALRVAEFTLKPAP
jgi:hypothetical protein